MALTDEMIEFLVNALGLAEATPKSRKKRRKRPNRPKRPSQKKRLVLKKRWLQNITDRPIPEEVKRRLPNPLPPRKYRPVPAPRKFKE